MSMGVVSLMSQKVRFSESSKFDWAPVVYMT